MVLRDGVEVPEALRSVSAVVETLSTDEDTEIEAMRWSEMGAWLRMAITVTSMFGGSMRRLPDETPDGQIWTVLSE